MLINVRKVSSWMVSMIDGYGPIERDFGAICYRSEGMAHQVSLNQTITSTGGTLSGFIDAQLTGNKAVHFCSAFDVVLEITACEDLTLTVTYSAESSQDKAIANAQAIVDGVYNDQPYHQTVFDLPRNESTIICMRQVVVYDGAMTSESALRWVIAA